MSELATRSAFDVEMNSENLQRLADWVANFATAEELAWNSDKFKDLRNLLKVQKAAKSLRVEAVKLECVALRRVGQAGLEPKIGMHDRAVAKWLAEMTDDEFDKLLDDSSNEVSPLSLMRACRDEQRNLSNHIGGYGSFDPDADISVYSIEREARDILRALEHLDSFTVEEAANELFNRFESYWGNELPREIADAPLKEVVRGVLRIPEPGRGVVLVGDTVTELPGFVTWSDSNEWRRIPWKSASVAHLRVMVETRELQARQMVEKAQEMRELLNVIEMSAKSESESADAAFIRAVQEGRARRITG
jgi:hypothetical protein